MPDHFRDHVAEQNTPRDAFLFFARGDHPNPFRRGEWFGSTSQERIPRPRLTLRLWKNEPTLLPPPPFPFIPGQSKLRFPLPHIKGESKRLTDDPATVALPFSRSAPKRCCEHCYCVYPEKGQDVSSGTPFSACTLSCRRTFRMGPDSYGFEQLALRRESSPRKFFQGAHRSSPINWYARKLFRFGLICRSSFMVGEAFFPFLARLPLFRLTFPFPILVKSRNWPFRKLHGSNRSSPGGR